MTELTVSIEISDGSQECVFAGNLLKAPPLNRRGRKKWHERYVVLRANKTLEIFKTRKAALSGKTARRVIDLRSCINLEVGLEYKNLQYILSIGTFKRTFFFAAASDPLMLQWAYLLEKTKSAQNGERIEVLDIGLRRSKDKSANHRVRTKRHSTGSSQQFATMPKSGFSKAQFTRESAETINLRGSLTESIKTQSDCSISESSASSEQSSPSHVSRQGSHVTIIPNRVPPPTGILATATRSKDGYFIVSPKKQAASPEKSKGEFVERPGSLHRGRAMKLTTTKATDSSPQHCTPNPGLSVKTDQSEALHLHSNMKRSFRYRKITLRPEAPLFENVTEDSENEQDDKEDSSTEGVEISEHHVLSRGTSFDESPPGHHGNVVPRASHYSKVTLSAPRKRIRSNSQPAEALDQVIRPLSHVTESCEDLRMLDSSLPERPPSDGLVYVSQSSLDNILVEPPDMFTDKPHEIVGHVTKGSSHMTARIIPSQLSPGALDLGDRNSTESNDTGYTSAVGSHDNQTSTEVGEFHLAFADHIPQEKTNNQKPVPDTKPEERVYVPMVFYSHSSSQLLVVVCLAENNQELIKDLIMVKAIEGFTLLACDEVHGHDNVSTATQDFTVSTSLEDLEFGFTVASSNTKDLFMRKVRESSFEIQHLFGGSKPFSCDVVVRHGEQMIVLPIEIELTK